MVKPLGSLHNALWQRSSQALMWQLVSQFPLSFL